MGCGTVNTLDKKSNSIKVNSQLKQEEEMRNKINKDSNEEDIDKWQSDKQSPISKCIVSEVKKPKMLPVITPIESNISHSVFNYYRENFDFNSKSISNPDSVVSNQANGFDTTIITINSAAVSNNNLLEFPKLVESSDKTSLNITVQASRFEAMYPIWIEKNKDITFEVKGKWRFEVYGMDIGPEGIKDSNSNSQFNQGSLVGRVLNNDYFAIVNNTEYKCEISGPLFLKINLNTLQNHPTGELKVKIYGGREMPFDKIEEKLGWVDTLQNLNLIDKKNKPDYLLPPLEKAVVILINKLRYNSELFAMQYLENISNITQSMKELYSFLKNNNRSIKALDVSVQLTKELENFYMPILSKNQAQNNKRAVKYNLKGSSNEVERYFKEKFAFKKINVFIKQHDDGKPMSLSIRFILDEKIKNEIFDESNTEIAMITLKSTKMNKSNYITIIVFSQKEIGGYDEKKGYAPKLEGFKNNFDIIGEKREANNYNQHLLQENNIKDIKQQSVMNQNEKENQNELKLNNDVNANEEQINAAEAEANAEKGNEAM